MLPSELINRIIGPCRDAVARGLVRLGLRPNHVTALGMLLTVGAGVAVACGRPYWRAWAVTLIVGAGACDMLDGAMAKVGGRVTRFGAIFDSTCDRAGDAALYLGPVFYYLLRPDAQDAAAPNLGMASLAAVGLVWAQATSYLRARAAAEGAEGGGGFWQRGERVVTLLLGLAFHHLSTAVWILGVAPLATVVHRLWRVARTTPGPDGRPPNPPGEDEPRGLLGVLLFRWPRLSVPFDIQAGVTIALLVFVAFPEPDWVRMLVAWLVGP
ncbi:MAG: CDP-alcohol phosphatidyltransferase family protein [Phycisphaerae bacterium]